VAALAKVSIATVSYVLNDSHPVSTMTKTAVLDAAEALEYRPNVIARNLQSNQSRLIGYGWHRIKPGQSVPLLDRFTYWMAQAAEAAGYHVLTFSNPDDEPTTMYEELIKTNRVDGFVLAHTNRNDPRIRFLMKAGIPFAAFGRANDSWHFPYVDSDGKTGISLAVQHLIALGHTQIAILGWPEGSLTGDDRLEGYFNALEAGAIAPRNDLVVRTENTIASAYAATVALLSRPKAPTALVCMSDTMAIGAMNYMNHMGIAIGKTVAVTGFDDDPVAEVFYPGLTTLRQPIDQIAAQVVALFLAEVGNERPNNYQILLAPELIVRGSSDPNCT
jgi:DNA-binding LacI/PurR family transcriptional regulator